MRPRETDTDFGDCRCCVRSQGFSREVFHDSHQMQPQATRAPRGALVGNQLTERATWNLSVRSGVRPGSRNGIIEASPNTRCESRRCGSGRPDVFLT